MDESLKKLLGTGPYPAPVNKLEEIMDFYQGPGMFIAVPKTVLQIPDEATHTHESFEFDIPLSSSQIIRLEKNNVMLQENRLYPLNAGQAHGSPGPMFKVRLIGMQIDKEFMQETCRLVYGRAGVSFKNDGYEFGGDMWNLLRSFMEEARNRQAGYEFILQSLSTQITVTLLRRIKSNMPALVTERRYTEKENVNRAIDFFMEHYNKEYSLADVARMANLSPYHFIKVFKAQTGKTPYDYLVDIKIDKARDMLRNNRNFTVTQICYLCGFNNLSHFTSVFKRRVGVTPSEYRKVLLGC